MVHNHTWCDRPPEGPLSWGKTWDERYFDTEALSENSEVKSEDYILDTLYTLEMDPMFRFSEDLWPEVVEWCSSCKENRRTKFVSKQVVEKVQALDGKEDNVLCKVALEEEIDSEVKEQLFSKVEELVQPEKVLVKKVVLVKEVLDQKVQTEEVQAKKVQAEEVQVEETEVIARSNHLSLRLASTSLPSTTFWRPWEASCEATAAREWSGEATTLLSNLVVTPPPLVTPPKEEERTMGRKVGRRLQRLLTFQATLEKEKGLPPSRWQKRLELGEEVEATFLNTPVSHRKKGRRRGEFGEAEASSPGLRGSRVEDVRYTFSPHKPGYGGLEASRYNPLLLHSSFTPGVWDGGGHRSFCYGCQSWGNIVPIM